MPILTAGEVAAVCGGSVAGDPAVRANAVVADSREAVAGSVFVAVRGGHAFVEPALAAGASFAVVHDAAAVPDTATAVVVADTVQALLRLGTWARSRLRARVVGITGSTGKTTTKDLTAAALGARLRVHASPRSYNTDVGMPLTLLSCPDDADAVVLEMGARHPGDIAELAAVARCEVGVITGIGKTHIGEFGSRDVIAATKTELLRALPADGLAVIPADDEYLPLMAASTSARVVSVGPGGAIAFRATSVRAPGRTGGVVTIDGVPVEVDLPVAGRALIRNAAYALAVARELGVDAGEAARAMADAVVSAARMEISTISGLTVINDAYNANPTSTAASLRTVRELAGRGPAWAVLGEMAELGAISGVEHARIARLARALGFEVVAVAAPPELADAPGVVGVASMEDAAALLLERAPAGAHVLVKGSLVTGLRRFPELLQDSGRRAGVGEDA